MEIVGAPSRTRTCALLNRNETRFWCPFSAQLWIESSLSRLRAKSEGSMKAECFQLSSANREKELVLLSPPSARTSASKPKWITIELIRGATTSLTHLIPTSHSLDPEECAVPSDHDTPSRKRPAATRKSGNECTVCAACTHIFLERFCKC